MRLYINSDHYIGREGYKQVVDEFGDSDAASKLRCGDYHRAHNELQTMTNAIFCQAGFATSVQLPNIFHRKVPSPCMKKYLNLRQKKVFAIPEILVHDDPKNSNAAEAHHMEAMFDVKTLRIDKNRYFYMENIMNFWRAVDTKVGTVMRDYVRRAERITILTCMECVKMRERSYLWT